MVSRTTIAFVKNAKSKFHRTKHVPVSNFFIKEKTNEGEIEEDYTPKLQMRVGMFTKPLQGEVF